MNDTAKTRLLRNLDIALEYEKAVDESNNIIPDRLIVNKDLVEDKEMINTPYFTRNSNDPFPLYEWKDERVKNICACVEKALASFGGI